MEKNVFYLNKELQLAKSKSDMIAIACYHKDDDQDSLYQLSKTRLGKIVEIMFLDAIGHKANWSESNKLTKEWAKEYYPQYQSFLPSKQICYLAKRKTDRTIDNCWTRTHGNDGYPQYRYSPIIIEDGICYLCQSTSIADNVFISLVMTKEEFLKINPDIKLQD